jgi:hypothetical protein
MSEINPTQTQEIIRLNRKVTKLQLLGGITTVGRWALIAYLTAKTITLLSLIGCGTWVLLHFINTWREVTIG